MEKVLILGSSRNDGDAKALADELKEKSGWDLVNLNDYNISYYDYEHLNRNDDYLDLMRELMAKYDTLVFVTPIYWYSMSGIMKVFFDRITDLLTIEKDLGRMLRGKKMAVISCSNGSNLGEAFWLPFSESAKYLGMEFIGGTHTVSGENNDVAIAGFLSRIGR